MKELFIFTHEKSLQIVLTGTVNKNRNVEFSFSLKRESFGMRLCGELMQTMLFLSREDQGKDISKLFQFFLICG